MREIKFRAWHKEYKKMLTVYVIHQGTYSQGFVKNCQGYIPPNDQYTFKFDQAEWMQYAGLKDKNGKEIYEGDIVEWKFNGEVRRYETFWDNSCGRWLSKNGDDITNFVHDSFSEIIGNIYENPELLK